LSHESKFVFPDGRVVDFNEVKPPSRKSTPNTGRKEKIPVSPAVVSLSGGLSTTASKPFNEVDAPTVPVSSSKVKQQPPSLGKEIMSVPSLLKVIDQRNELEGLDSYDFHASPVICQDSVEMESLSSSLSRPCTTSSERAFLLLSRPLSASVIDVPFNVEKELKRNQRKWSLLSRLNSLHTNERSINEILGSDRIIPESFGFSDSSVEANSPYRTGRFLEENVRFHPVSPKKKELLLPPPLPSVAKRSDLFFKSAGNLGSHASLLFDRPVSSSSKSYTSQKRHHFSENTSALVSSHFRNILSRGSERDDSDLYSDFGL
jgi:hypothetical protein